MNETLGRQAREVLASIRAASGPGALERERAWAALQQQIPTPLGGLGPDPAAGVAAFKATALVKVLSGSVLALVVGAGAMAWSVEAAPPAASASVLPPAPLPSPSLAAVVPSVAPPATASLPPRSSARPLVVRSPSSLSAEAELLHQARLALQAGQLAATQQKLLEHTRLFPNAQLLAARSLLRVKLACAQGNLEAAKREASKLRRAARGSSEVTGLATTCAKD